RYKTPGPPEDAINALHRYRDAILELIPDNNSLITPSILETESNFGKEVSSYTKSGDLGKSEEFRVPKRVVVQAAALFPYDEARNKINYPSFNEGLLWKSLEKLGIGAIPFLPSNTSYMRSWIRTALRRGGWATADITLDHAARSRAQAWKIASSEIVMIGVLRNIDPEEHLSWINSRQIYYTPLQKDQRRQLSVNSIAIYSPKSLQSKRSVGAVTHVAKVLSIEVKKRSEIATPWQNRKGNDQLQIVYKLGKLITLDRPIENISGQRFSINRWSSRLALERAAILEELFLETEAEWRLYEALKVNKVDFKLVANRFDSNARTDFLLKDASVVAYEQTSGFLLKCKTQKTVCFAKVEDLLEKILETR
ncbi:MAG: hypothetical protein JNN15_08040, partial [Blastocatellia bacterium]|nr:hypothetical protein [Blastocatellia bacterium]